MVDSSNPATQSKRVNVAQLREFVQAQPFESFSLVMASGERLHVPHEDFIWIMPNKRVVQVALPNGASRWVNLQLVAGLEKPTNGTGSAKNKGKRRS
jgi:hypothetical protein